MKTLGLEMVDAGFEVAVGRAAAAGGRAQSERLVPPGTVPAVALLEEGNLHVGAEAEARRLLFPRQVCDNFWDELSLQPSNLRRGGRPLLFSELAYTFLRHVVDGLPGVASEHESLVLALPPAFTETSERAEERLGILLGICGDLELRLGAIVDSACVALLDPEAAPASRGSAVVIDLGLHAAIVSLVDVDGTMTRRGFSRIPGAGWLALTDLARRMLAARFLRQTSYDVASDRRTDQEFYNETRAALATFTSQPEAWLRVTSAARERAISVPRDGLVIDLRPLAESITQGVVELLGRNARAPSNVQIYLTARARHLCGLATALRARGALAVSVLSAGAAARGAAVLSAQRPAVKDLADVPIETSIALPESENDAGVAVRTAFSFHRHGGKRDLGPTHVVIDGVGHPLKSSGMRIAAGGHNSTSDLSLAVAPVGVGACDLLVEPVQGKWHVSAAVGENRLALPGGDVPLAAGDVLEIHGLAGAVRVQFVRVQG